MQKGVSLIELIIVIAIIAIVTVIVIPNYRSGNQLLALQRSAHKLHHDIRRAQEMAMASVEESGSVPPGGFGIFFEEDQPTYLIYADMNTSEKYDAGDIDVSNLELENKEWLEISEINAGGACASGSINFKPPDPTVNIYCNGHQKPEITITITLLTLSETRFIHATEAGLIYVEE